MLCFLLISFSLLCNHVYGIGWPEVKLKQGLLRGVYEEAENGKQFISFLGIPYAKPPVGKYRFKDPSPASSWPGIYYATRIGSDCMQYDHTSYKTKFEIHGSEDCLYINVFTPKLPRKGMPEKLMDVILHIHGGAFMFLAGHYFGPKYLLMRDVVYVNFNYRLGPLGFLSTEDDLITGNYGLKDQVLAMRWVKENIAAFGGNPESITIAGLSAGAASVNYHLLSPLSKGLFKGAISASGSVLCPWAQVDHAREKAYTLATELGCPWNSTKMIECLQKRPARHIVDVSKKFMSWKYLPFSPFGPVVEKSGPTAFLDKNPIEIMKEGRINDVPWLISFTSHEGLYPGAEIICERDSYVHCTKEWNKIAPTLLDFELTANKHELSEISKQIWLKYIGDSKTAAPDDIIEILSDRHFLAYISQAVKLQASVMKSPIYAYKFSYRGQSSLSDYFCETKGNYGVSHGDDTAYIVSTFYLYPNQTEDEIKMRDAMVELWISFAENGKPNFQPVTKEWPPVKDHLPGLAYLNIISPNSVEILNEKDFGNLEFWQSLNLKENVMRDVHHTKEEL